MQAAEAINVLTSSKPSDAYRLPPKACATLA
jgi:hypothetical protein